MYTLIFTVFIAELIISVVIIQTLIKSDKKIIVLNEQVITSKEALQNGLSGANESVKTINSGIKNTINFVKQKQKEYSRKLVKLLILYICMIFCKSRYKQAAIIFQLAIALKDYINDSKNVA